ncbi:aminoglycoside phosphotransferase family protein [Flexivirga meconopsidis]|uniref:aminoglycoside phosphotransferase family protein n=1 Tax=Flexivirga meconopsidis TaxID=2977121 RepID=UPI00223EF475|nr:aminoglycoside phosphotransferase family protein [Flexivirga meconopsidis]
MSPAVGMHEGELEISTDQVRTLVREQFPQWAALPAERVASTGTVNALFRLGSELVARPPLVPDDDAAADLDAEIDAAARFADATTAATPSLVARGEPSAAYPLPWSVWRWIPGRPAGEQLSGSVQFASQLGHFVREVRLIATDGRQFDGRGRGGVIADHEEWVEHCLEKSVGIIDVAALSALWTGFRALPRGDQPDTWTHNDLMPGNLLVRDGALAGVIDVGQAGVGDPAVDLQPAWNLFTAEARDAFRGAVGADDAQWERGRAWAFVQAMGSVWYYRESNPAMASLAHRTLTGLLESS